MKMENGNFSGEEKLRVAMNALESARGSIDELENRLKKDMRDSIYRSTAIKYASTAVKNLEIFQESEAGIRKHPELIDDYQTYYYRLLVEVTELLEILVRDFDEINWSKEEANDLDRFIDEAEMHLFAYHTHDNDMDDFNRAKNELKMSLVKIK